jgi:hypothetical protein
MPITLRFEGDLIHTRLVGRVTIEDLLAHYASPALDVPRGAWREIVDDRAMTEMAITANDQERLAAFVATKAPLLRNGRVAMLASTEVCYGMFRMWEIQREDLDYSVTVFRDVAAARQWLGFPPLENPS